MVAKTDRRTAAIVVVGAAVWRRPIGLRPTQRVFGADGRWTVAMVGRPAAVAALLRTVV